MMTPKIAAKFEPALKWFTGKALENAKAALAMLTEADALGYWPPKYSRKVEAALNKCAVAHKAGKATENLLKVLKDGTEKEYSLGSGWLIAHHMQFGATKAAPDVLAKIAAVEAYNASFDAATASALATAKEWATDFAPMGEAMKMLDATRPKPVYFMKTLSKTVLGNVAEKMGIALETIQMPEIIYVKVPTVDEKGNKGYMWVPEIKWPEGTRHHTSKLGTAFSHCEACGHAIKVPTNWVPLLAYTADGPVSVWTGSDCAENLFGCDVKNKVDFTKAPKAE